LLSQLIGRHGQLIGRCSADALALRCWSSAAERQAYEQSLAEYAIDGRFELDKTRRST
jgi:hypothetical protein